MTLNFKLHYNQRYFATHFLLSLLIFVYFMEIFSYLNFKEIAF